MCDFARFPGGIPVLCKKNQHRVIGLAKCMIASEIRTIWAASCPASTIGRWRSLICCACPSSVGRQVARALAFAWCRRPVFQTASAAGSARVLDSALSPSATVSAPGNRSAPFPFFAWALRFPILRSRMILLRCGLRSMNRIRRHNGQMNAKKRKANPEELAFRLMFWWCIVCYRTHRYWG